MMPVVRYQVDGAVATVTMNRPEVANAQNSALIDGIDACFDRADADDDVRVVVLAADRRALVPARGTTPPSRRSSAGPRPTAVVEWPASCGRHAREGKLRHEQVMYVERCRRIHDFRKPTIAAVQGKCVAGGLMLACMCDLIVAADDAAFSNPVLRMTGAGVELLVEPWEMGIRKAKEFLLAAMELDAEEACRLGLVNRVVPRAELADQAADLARRVALVPAVTAQVVKSSLNYVGELQGKSASWKYHFMAHHWTHNTATALSALEERKAMGSMKEVFAARDGGDSGPEPGKTAEHVDPWPPGPPLQGVRVLDVGTRIGAPFCAGLLGEWGAEVVKVEQPGRGDFMRDIGPFADRTHKGLRGRPVPAAPHCCWAVGRPRPRKERHLRPAHRRGGGPLPAPGRHRRCRVRELPPRHRSRSGGSDRPILDAGILVYVRISAFGQDGPNSLRPGLDRLGVAYGGLMHLTGEADRPPVRPGVTVADYLTGVFAAQAALAALYRRDAGPQGRSGP